MNIKNTIELIKKQAVAKDYKVLLLNNKRHMIRRIKADLKSDYQNFNNIKEREIIRYFLNKHNIEYDIDRSTNAWYVMPIYLSGVCEYFRPSYFNNFRSSTEWKLLRERVFDTYGYKCMKCGYYSESNHVDHIYPISLYPEKGNDFNNLQVLCKRCNSAKGNRIIKDFRDKVDKNR